MKTKTVVAAVLFATVTTVAPASADPQTTRAALRVAWPQMTLHDRHALCYGFRRQPGLVVEGINANLRAEPWVIRRFLRHRCW